MGINKKNIVVANFKMYLPSKSDTERWLENFLKSKNEFSFSDTWLILCPPVVFLNDFETKIKTEWVGLGAQNCFWENEGAFTGEIGPRMINSLHGKFVILGHSEIRRDCQETDDIIAKKINQVLKIGLSPILCVGENQQQKEQDRTAEIILNQLENCLSGVSKGKIEDVVICYEPVWAISANEPDHLPTVNEIMSARLLIKKFLAEKYGIKSAQRVKIIYGGSVDDKNINDVCLKPEMNGVLVGKASTIPHTLLRICKLLEEEKSLK